MGIIIKIHIYGIPRRWWLLGEQENSVYEDVINSRNIRSSALLVKLLYFSCPFFDALLLGSYFELTKY